jgi:hypothetical protein
MQKKKPPEGFWCKVFLFLFIIAIYARHSEFTNLCGSSVSSDFPGSISHFCFSRRIFNFKLLSLCFFFFRTTRTLFLFILASPTRGKPREVVPIEIVIARSRRDEGISRDDARVDHHFQRVEVFFECDDNMDISFVVMEEELQIKVEQCRARKGYVEAPQKFGGKTIDNITSEPMGRILGKLECNLICEEWTPRIV